MSEHNMSEPQQEQEIKLKTPKGKFARNMQMIIPLVEEITNQKLLPFCLIGFAAKGKSVKACFSTMHDSHDDSVYIVCKQFIQSYEKTHPHLLEPPPPTKL